MKKFCASNAIPATSQDLSLNSRRYQNLAIELLQQVQLADE